MNNVSDMSPLARDLLLQKQRLEAEVEQLRAAARDLDAEVHQLRTTVITDGMIDRAAAALSNAGWLDTRRAAKVALVAALPWKQTPEEDR